MNMRKTIRFLRNNLIFYIAGFLLLFGMKYCYSKADCEGLRWILGPTARWVETLCGIPFLYEPGMGYANHSLRFLIAPSCSGVQFMIITVAMLIFSFVHEAADAGFSRRPYGSKGSCPNQDSGKTAPAAGTVDAGAIEAPWVPGRAGKAFLARTGKGLGWIAASLLLSYGLTVFVNGLRIIVAIYLPSFLERIHAFSSVLTADRLHTIIGAVVYFAALLTIHQLTGLLFRKPSDISKGQAPGLILRKCLSPLFWYFAIVLGVPFLNRACQKNGGQFVDFALLVTACCGFVTLLYALTFLLCRRHQPRGRD